jgi:hypothetical protein
MIRGERFGLGLQPGDFCLHVFERSHSFLFLYVVVAELCQASKTHVDNGTLPLKQAQVQNE